MRTSPLRLLWGLTLLLPLAALPAGPQPAFADQPAAAVAPSPAPAAPAPGAATGGMVVTRDPETGEFTLPTPDQRRELFPEEFGAALQTGQPLFEEPLAAGGYMIRLDGLLMDYLVATRGPDGKLSLSCVPAADVASRLGSGALAPAVTPAPEEE